MKVVVVTAEIFFLCLVFVEGGCGPTSVVPEPPGTDNGFNELSVYTRYAPAKVDILPLTEFVFVSDSQEESKINVYVSLLDRFDCQKKSPGVFRFELYEYVQRSAEPKGGRIAIWPDIDLTDAVENNNYWRDFLRAYEFNLLFEPESNRSYILQVTCLCPNGRRLSAEFALKHTE